MQSHWSPKDSQPLSSEELWFCAPQPLRFEVGAGDTDEREPNPSISSATAKPFKTLSCAHSLKLLPTTVLSCYVLETSATRLAVTLHG